jgi:hypothetical protein
MSVHSYAKTSSATMRAGFPTLPELRLGTPNLFILNDLLQYISKCAQTHKSTISKKMNQLYVAVDPALYTHYLAGKAYPTNQYPFPHDVDEVPNFTTCNNDNNRAAAKIMHAIALKTQNDVVNMNTALIDTLLSLIPTAFKILYKQEQMMDPKTVFRQCFDWFVVKYRCTLAEDCNTNRTAMAADWHPSMGFEVLTLRLFCGITFASLSRHPITNNDTVNIGVHVHNCTGLFAKEYKAWILCGDNASKANNFAAFKSFWENAVQIAAFTSVPASQHGYGMAATNKDAEFLMDVVSNFGTAYAATQESLRSTTANIAAMQGQIQMLCQAIGAGQPPPAIQYQQQHPHRPHGGRGHGQQHGGGKHNGGNHGSGSGNGGGYGSGNTGNQPPTGPPPPHW